MNVSTASSTTDTISGPESLPLLPGSKAASLFASIRPPHNKLFSRYQAMFPSIEGWLFWEAVLLLQHLNRAQVAEGIVGNFAEIGAYRGKLSLAMATFLNPDRELLIVNDIFDMPELNTSCSGMGATVSAFAQNFRKLDPDPKYVRLLIKRSDAVTPEEIGSGIRFFSVDGGHSADETRNDMRVAALTLHDRGMIVLDDYFNQEWPGVAEGVDDYFKQHDDLAPLAAFYNKFVFVKRSSLEWFRNLLQKHAFDAFCQSNNWLVRARTLHGFDYRLVSTAKAVRPAPPVQ
ncbi:MAG TPA: class I SAM-dependent methyltransferase [Verrucomicrobiae bacterium]|nr:class I SAM-dependent methyltransferase [Verrucomicrobiae bacterium]